MAKARNGKKTKGRKQAKGSGSGPAGPVCNLPSFQRKVYKFERCINIGNLTPAAADKGWSWTFALNSISNVSEFTSLFDEYRITALEVTFTLQSSVGAYAPTILMSADYDSTYTATVLTDILQRPHKRIVLTPSSPMYTFRFRPRGALAVQGGSGYTYVPAAPGQWMDCNDPSVPYNGITGWIQNFNSGGSQPVIGMSVRMMFDCANVR